MVAHIYAKDSRANLSSVTGHPVTAPTGTFSLSYDQACFCGYGDNLASGLLGSAYQVDPTHIYILLLQMFPHCSPRFERQFLNRSRPFESEGYDSTMREASLFLRLELFNVRNSLNIRCLPKI